MRKQSTEFIQDIKELSPFPDISLDLMALINQFDLNFKQIKNKIKLDQVTTVFLLNQCNLNSENKTVFTVEQAIESLGKKNAQKELLAYFQRHLYTYPHKEKIKSLLLYHSIGVAVFSKKLCELFGLNPEEGYTAGLLHDIGKQVLYLHNEYNFQKIIDQIGKSGKLYDSLEMENESFQFDHTEIGNLLLKKLNMADVMIDAVTFHHNEEYYLKDQGIVSVVAFANKLVQKVVEKKVVNVNSFLQKFSISVAQMIEFSKSALRELSEYLTFISE